MSALKLWWENLGKAYTARAPREQALLAVAAVAGVLMLGNALLVEPRLAKTRVAQGLADKAKAELQTSEHQLQTLRTQMNVDLDAGNKAELVRLRTEVTATETALKQVEGRLVSPAQMNALLERMLASSSLRLVSLKSLAPVNLAARTTNADTATAAGAEKQQGADEPGLYKHGVELRLEGTYADLYQWLGQMERAPQRLLWGDVRLSVNNYPKTVLTLTVYTLSSEKAWLAI
ncbi:MAG: hypothetical protein H6943_04445 [Zoogloeaceae bacterium]|nr:hypothetical protein [Zoogloeaceae bacterium]